jgi:tetratricopeptide (TPR) repeat protein
MQLGKIILRIIILSVIAAALTFGLHLYLKKRTDDRVPRNAQAAQTTETETQTETIPPSAEPVPPVEPPKPEVADIIKPGEDLSGLVGKARESLAKKDYKSAVELCGKMAEKDNKAFLCVGMSHFMLGEYAKAVIALEKAAGSGADEFMCRKYLSYSYYYTHDLDKSISNAEKALALKKEPQLEAFLARLMREKNAHRHFVRESSSHFKIEYDGYEHGRISRSVISMLEDAYSTIGRDFDYFPSETITVILYTRHDFHDVTRLPGWVGGFFDIRDGKIRVPVRGAEGKEDLLKKVLFHEYVHAMVHSITKNCPLWVNEGLAEYYSKGPDQRVGQVIPLNHLEKSFAGLDGRGIAFAYMESHSAVSYLMQKYGAYRIKNFLVYLSKGVNIHTAFTDSFQLSYTEFIDKWGKR